MADASWSLDLPDGRRQIDVAFGFWSGKATVRVDGRTVSTSRRILEMGFNLGVDIPVEVGQHHVVVSIRPTLAGSMIITGYRFGLSVDGVTAPGTEPIAPKRSENAGPRLIETVAWASAGGALIGLSQHGRNPAALLFLAAPAACSWVTRRTTLSTGWMGLVSLVIFVMGLVAVAIIGSLIRR